MFPSNAPSANPVFYRTYSRKVDGRKESWEDVVERTTQGLREVGKFTDEEYNLVREQLQNLHTLPSGRWLWVGGTPWINKPENYSGAYNCTSTDLVDPKAFALQMELLMMGSGTGAVIEPRTYNQLPTVETRLDLYVMDNLGENPGWTEQTYQSGNFIYIGDSRQGWCDGLLLILKNAFTLSPHEFRNLSVDLSAIRPAGTPIAGFGGVSNPVRLAETYRRVARILNNAKGRKLTSVEACLILDESSLAVVAGNVRRSAGMRQFSQDDAAAAVAKDNLWVCDSEGQWKIDPERDALRMANHTRVFHRRPSLAEVTDSVRKQFESGEGAIQYAPEAIARANADVLDSLSARRSFISTYEDDPEAARAMLSHVSGDVGRELDHRMHRYGLNPCGEILGKDFHCNLSEVHLNTLDPEDLDAQRRAFQAGALAAGALLHHEFVEDRYQYSREQDPIVGVSFTGLFDFCVNKWGAEWLRWWSLGRPFKTEFHDFILGEARLLEFWKGVVKETLEAYCAKHGLKMPNRYTTVQPAGTKSLLTGASPGWHPPKSARFIRRITFAKNDPVALACIDYGYTVVPSQSSRDEEGNLLNDPWDERVKEWLVEIPTETVWANKPECDQYDPNQFSVRAQFDFYMQVQKFWTTHNTSATLEFRENEIPALSELIYRGCGEGYISAALLARFDANETFPRLPFEPIDEATYFKMQTEVNSFREMDFHDAMAKHFDAQHVDHGPAACDSDKCLFEEKK